MTDNTRYDDGLKVRSEVLGPEYVQASLGRASDFSRPMQQLVTEYCWGASGPGPGWSGARAAC